MANWGSAVFAIRILSFSIEINPEAVDSVADEASVAKTEYSVGAEKYSVGWKYFSGIELEYSANKYDASG